LSFEGKDLVANSLPEWVQFTLSTGAYPLDSYVGSPPLETDAVHANHENFDFVQNEVLIDVTDTCNFNINTGIQRVVRNLVKELLLAKKAFRLVTWTSSEEAFRMLTDGELKVVTGENLSLGRSPEFGLGDPPDFRKLIPMGCNVLVPELATQTKRVARSVYLANNSSNSFFAIIHDSVPILLPDTTGDGMVSAFTTQLNLIKACKTVIANSSSTAHEVTSLLSGLHSQGKTPPFTVELPLPTSTLFQLENMQSEQNSPPRLLVVGSHEPRKNHERILAAAELLWQEGHDFELHFVGGRGWNSEYFWELFSLLKQRGRKVFSHFGITDQELMEMYLTSDAFLSFSLHEGFGLPISEAATAGLRVITTNHGGQGELARLFSAQVSQGTGVLEIREALHLFLNEENEFMDSTINKKVKTASLSTWEQYAKEVFELVKL
jgi:glycosyltransferase involved in cell wall biosynthesis